MRIGVITIRQASGEIGGAERFYDALTGAFKELGHDAVEVPLVADESDFEQIKRNYLACYDLDLTGFDMVVSTKAPTWLLRHPRHVCYLVHTIRVFYDMFDEVFPRRTDELLAQRELIHQLDTGALQPSRCRAVFTIGEEVSRRLSEYNGIESTVLHPPLWADSFRSGAQGDYFLLPGRLHPWKRVDLMIKAMRHVRVPMKLKIVGVGEAEEALRELAAGDDRIEFLGHVDDATLRDLYAGALAVPFTPKREDYGYVTLEAFASGKPVITCSDSGEAAALVRDGVNGRICDPDPIQLANVLEQIADDRPLAARMGAEGQAWVKGLSWKRIAHQLMEAAEMGTS